MFGFGRPQGGCDGRLYKVLGVDKDATPSQIKKAYHRLARENHPDRGGDEEKFKTIQFAFDILGDQKKRDIYDNYGEEAAKDGHEPGGGMEDLLGAMFGGGGRRGGGRRKAKEVVHRLRVSLEDLYKGKTSKLALQRSRVCIDCHGKGAEGDIQTKCQTCHGRGVQLHVRQLGPGMIQQMQAVCSSCDGKGSVIPDKFKCKHCHGNGVVEQRKVIEVYIEPGMRDESQIRIEGEGDERPDVEAGDVVIVLQQKEHDLFKRRGNDLLVEKTITLQEALCGYEFHIKTLDDRLLKIKTEANECIQPNEFRVVHGEGMPIGKKRDLRGKMIIHFKVQFPKSLSTKEVQAVRKLWPLPPSDGDIDEGDHIDHEYVMQPVDAKRLVDDMRNDAADDDDDMPHGSRVQCAQQ
eukprot:Rmarinus@m.489